MKKRVLAIVILVMMLFAMGCSPQDNGPVGGNDNNESNNDTNSNTNNDSRSVEEKNADGEFFYKGKIISNQSSDRIEIEIIDSQVAFGRYDVLVDAGTVYLDSNGNSITRDDLKVDDVVEVIFSGQVMLSLPPQIYAQKIVLK